MNTIKDPLILTWGSSDPIFDEAYSVNKPGEQSGEYVDKALAEEMLEALETMIEMLDSSEEDEITENVKKLILKAKG